MQSQTNEVINTRGTPEFREMLDKRRRHPKAPKKGFQPTQLWDRYQEIARRIVIGQKNVEIANDMNVTPEMVSYVRNSDLVQARIDTLQTAADSETVNIASRIKSMAPKALDILQAVLDGRVDGEKIPAKLRAEHAEKLLDRAGYAPPREIKAHMLHGHYTAEDIERIKKRATDASMNAACSIIVEDVEEGLISSK